MLTSIELSEQREVWASPAVKPLDEAVGQAWVMKGRAQEKQANAMRMKAVKWLSIGGLLVVAGLWSYLTPYDILVGFVLTAGAMIVMFQAFHARHHTVAAVFGALALLYNPVAPVFSFSDGWQRALVVVSIVTVVVPLAFRNMRGRNARAKLVGTLLRSAVTAFLVFGVLSAATLPGDLSKYRNFQLGTDLPTVASQVGTNLSQATVIHRRPALIQELKWRPVNSSSSTQREAAEQVAFTFYDGQLFRIAVDYDRYQTEGLTADDLVEAMSASYGVAAKPTALAKAGIYGEQEEVLAQWQDAQYCFELIRSSYGPSYKLVGVLKRLDAQAQAAILEAKRLDDQEAPQRDAARIASEAAAEGARREKARLVNKPRFRP